MRDHLRLMLMFLFALVKKVHLIDVEEFRRLKGYEARFRNLRIHEGECRLFSETFCAMTLPNGQAVTFSSKPGSRGRVGFQHPRLHH